jgi:hypothetical protein
LIIEFLGADEGADMLDTKGRAQLGGRHDNKVMLSGAFIQRNKEH